jgi:Ca-activated chloride channel homolog
MTFAWPHLLWLLLLPAGLLGWDITQRRREAAATRPKILRAEAGARSLQLVAGRPPRPNSTGPRVWLAIGLALVVFALARPQWGQLEEPVFDQSREILLAIDLSRSMLASDIKPSRLDRAKLLIQSLLERLAGERVGLLVFSGTAFLQSPLSADYEILREFLPALGPDFLPEGGTNYRALIDTAIDAFTASASADRFLIVLSDGEATDEAWRSRAAELKKRNIRVIGLGVGTAGGSMIPDGSGGFVKDERGAVVVSKLESATLQDLADITDGIYRDASTWVDLAALLEDTVEAGRKGEFVEKNIVRLVERFQWPLALGLWCLLVSIYYEFPVRPRTRDIRLTTRKAPGQGTGGREQEKIGSVPVALLIGILLASFSLIPSPARAAAPAPAPAADLSPLGRMVGRLAAAPVRTARDWAELARETVNWGTGLLSQQQTVPEGPVRDALAAVELGSKLDAGTADWPKLREELEALLRNPEDEQEQPQDENQQQQEQDQQSQDQDQSQQGTPGPQDPNQQESPDQNDAQSQEQEQPPQQPQGQRPPGESAFGDMSEKQDPPPPPPGDTQKVGGAPERTEPPGEPQDPSLALPLQKLDQLRNQDSPAELFQLMEGDQKPAKKPGKDW